jgi:hypothetical protein
VQSNNGKAFVHDHEQEFIDTDYHNNNHPLHQHRHPPLSQHPHQEKQEEEEQHPIPTTNQLFQHQQEEQEERLHQQLQREHQPGNGEDTLNVEQSPFLDGNESHVFYSRPHSLSRPNSGLPHQDSAIKEPIW